MITIGGWSQHGKVTVGKKRRALKNMQKQLATFKAIANPTRNQLNQILILESEIPRLEQSIRAWV
ncbi:hypothetical protein [Pantoea phage LIMElight]|uniref:Uncharacterized protein n=1 Tax=Pantoea phage LIMElight TaxID=881915 RepID=E1Y3X5_9CAUD|nr:hypothetical protein F370_gp02 [Pantoea phage LIMElight]CBW54760.1 hypothetical protein [Pantoea phage LIMElight]